MKVSTIANRGERVYLGVQFLLTGATISALYLLLVSDRGPLAGWLSFLCFCATITGFATLVYLRHSLSYQLKNVWSAEQERYKLLSLDQLTGALSRRYFLDALRDRLGTPLEPKDAVLLLVDLDYFKQLNDSFGHHCGDAALRKLVQALQDVFPQSVIGRLGGDEFGVVAATSNLAACRRDAVRLLQLLQAGMVFEGKQIALGASIGIAASPIHAGDVDELLSLADLALYESKRGGRNRATVFDRDMLAGQRHHRFLERELRAAVYLDDLELHYQPIVDADGDLIALEALVRWRHATRGLISPSEFIPVAEQSGLIDVVGAWVFRRACIDALTLPGERISINISAEQLKRDELVTTVARILAETGQKASRFVLEITETAAMSADDEVVGRLRRLREMGFRIALDDFGTGHCGFNYLRTLPIHSIKIDRSYIRSMSSDPVAQVFTAALSRIAAVLDLTIVAEGVETETEFELARDAGCNRFQGYLFGRALPAWQITRIHTLSHDMLRKAS